MYKFIAPLLMLLAATNLQAADDHSHTGHLHEQLVDGQHIQVDPERFDRFEADLNEGQIAVVSVMGMVCDFCARGIEKTFAKDKSVRKIDVDLANGKVLIAYPSDKQIDREEIDKRILANGQNVTDLLVLSI